jgi:uncharacterized membrane protein
MDQDQLTDLKTIIAGLDSRLRRIENKLYAPEEPPARVEHVAHVRVAPTPRPRPAYKKESSEPTNLLGILGVGCLIVAMILLIKFSVDSGWLTPYRQLLLAALFGGSLISIPFFVDSKDKTYISLLPSAGIVILHLTVYGAVFFHQVVEPVTGLYLVWAVGALSLWLLSIFNEDIFAIFAIAGTYLGSYLLKDNFADLTAIAFPIIVWDIIFAAFAVKLKNRSLISIAAYFSLGLVVFFSFSMGQVSVIQAQQIATIQLIQIMIFAVSTGVFSVVNKSILREHDAMMLFPVFLFFYGQEFYFIDLINPTYATIFSLAFAATILAIYGIARSRLGKEHLESSGVVLTLVSVMFFHSVYFVSLGVVGQLIFGLALMAVLGLLGKTLQGPAMLGPKLLSFLVIGHAIMLVVTGPGELSATSLLVFGFLYGALFFTGYQTTKNNILMTVANILVVVSICRLKDVIGEIWVGPLCVAYAFGCLIMALKGSDKVLAQASLPVVVFAIGRFVFFNFSNLSPLERIISLLVMGALIYAGGYVYRKIPSAEVKTGR